MIGTPARVAPLPGQAAVTAPPAPVDDVKPVIDLAALPVVQTDATDAQADAGQAGTIVVTGRRGHAPGDPLEGVNAASFGVTQGFDRALVAPVSMAYKRTVPSPIRSALHNILSNLHEPVVFLNYLLQLKPGKAAETAGRFLINSTIGVAGAIDVAKRRPFNLPHRPNGFEDTLGYYGVKPGPFLFVPLVGPTTVRDLIGKTLDRLVLPLGVGKPFNQPAYTIPASTTRMLDHRVGIDGELNDIRESPDPYAAARTRYLQERQAEIDRLHSRPKRAPTPPVADPTASATAPTD